MATLGLAVAGAAVGAAIGGPFGAALLGAQLGFLAGSIIGSLLFAPEFTTEGNRLDDTSVTTSTYGKTIPLIYGTRRVGGNVFWSTDLIEHRQKQTESGGKGGPKSVTITYTYTSSFAVGLCAGPVSCVTKIWADGKLIVNLSGDGEPLASDALGLIRDPREVFAAFSNPTDNADDVAERSITLPGLRIYLGTATQEPDPAIQEDVGIDDTPAYRGTCYLLFQDLLLTDFGNRIPQITALVSHPSCIEAFPFDSVTVPGGKYDAGNMWYSSDFKVGVVNDAERLIHIDLVNHEIIKIIPYTNSQYEEGAEFIDVDLGFMLIPRDTQPLSGNSTIDMVDIHTGAKIGGSQLNEWRGPVGHHDGTTHRADGWVYMWGRASGGNWQAINMSSLEVSRIFTEYNESGGATVATLALAYSFTLVGHRLSDYPWITTPPSTNNLQTCWVDKFGKYWIFWLQSGSGWAVSFSGPAPDQDSILEFPDAAAGAWYEGVEHAIIVEHSGGGLAKYSLDDGSLLKLNSALDVPLNFDDDAARQQSRSMPFAGQMLFRTSIAGALARVDIINLVDVDPGFTATDWQSGLGVGEGSLSYNPIDHSYQWTWSASSANYFNYLDRGDPGTEILSDVVTDISLRAGLTASDINVTGLTSDIVYGWVISNQAPAKNSIRALMQPYFFDVVESDFIIKFPKRGGSVVRVIPEDDLGASEPGKNAEEHVVETRPQEFENLPAVISVSYPDQEQDDLTNTQVWRRAAEAVKTTQRLDIDLPFVFPNSVARNIIERLGAQFWAERTQYQTILNWKHVDLDPADVIQIVFQGATATIFITDFAYGANGQISLEALSQDTTVYTRTAPAQDQLGVPDQSVIITGPSFAVVADMQSLRIEDIDELAYYLAGGPSAAGGSFGGVEVFTSTDQVNWVGLGVILPSEQSVIGYTTNKLATPEFGHTIFDRTNTLNVSLTSGSLSSATESQVLDGITNVLVVQSSLDNSWEIIQFVNATLEANGTYTIDTLLRGRRGSENYMSGHIVGDRVFVPSTLTTRNANYNSTVLGTTRFHRSVTLGAAISQGNGSLIIPVGRRLRPWAPGVDEAYTDSNGDVRLVMKRRARVTVEGFGEMIQDLADLDFEVDFANSDGTVVRTLTTTATANGSVVTVPTTWSNDVTVFYDAADIAADSFDGTSAICYQLNAALQYLNGRGEPRTVLIDSEA